MRRLFGFLPLNNKEKPPIVPTLDPEDREIAVLNNIIPDDSNVPYDMRLIIKSICDEGIFDEQSPQYARNIIVGFGRMGGRTVGIVANQPQVLAGVLDVSSSRKGARFVRFCDAFNIPLITFVDVPGFMPGTE